MTTAKPAEKAAEPTFEALLNSDEFKDAVTAIADEMMAPAIEELARVCERVDELQTMLGEGPLSHQRAVMTLAEIQQAIIALQNGSRQQTTAASSGHARDNSPEAKRLNMQLRAKLPQAYTVFKLQDGRYEVGDGSRTKVFTPEGVQQLIKNYQAQMAQARTSLLDAGATQSDAAPPPEYNGPQMPADSDIPF